jgi:hypothetical protein
MRASLGHWFAQLKPRRGVLAGGVRPGEGEAAIKAWEQQFTTAGVENALRCVADIYQVLQLNGIAPARLRLVYQKAWLHCERGADGSCLGVFTVADLEAYDAEAVDKLLKEFQILSGIKRP